MASLVVRSLLGFVVCMSCLEGVMCRPNVSLLCTISKYILMELHQMIRRHQKRRKKQQRTGLQFPSSASFTVSFPLAKLGSYR